MSADLTETSARTDVIDPALPVIDCHHHLLDRVDEELAGHLGLSRFLLDEYLKRIDSGHNVVATVAVEARTMYRAQASELMRVVGETEFLNGQAAMAASGLYGPCQVAAGIVAYADFRAGDAIRPVLEAHIAAAPERFKGIRQEGLWDEDETVLGGLFDVPEHFYLAEQFRRGLAHLAPLGLSFDAFVLSPQLTDLVDLARTFPETRIIVNHVGSPVGVGRHAGRLGHEYPQWKRDMVALAECPNAVVKLGGLGSYLLGSTFYRTDPPPGEEALIADWKPYVEPTIEMFGPDRCMFESNLPTDGSGSFRTVCNAFKLMTAQYSQAERGEIFAGTAARAYRLDLPQLVQASAAVREETKKR